MSPAKQRPPLWMTMLIIVFLLPAFSFPVLVANLPAGEETVKTFVWIYPFYMLLSAWLAWSAYQTSAAVRRCFWMSGSWSGYFGMSELICLWGKTAGS